MKASHLAEQKIQTPINQQKMCINSSDKVNLLSCHINKVSKCERENKSRVHEAVQGQMILKLQILARKP